MPPPTQFNNDIEDILSDLSTLQSDYIQSNGHYFQGLNTHNGRPESNVPTQPDLVRHPTDQAESWGDVGVLGSSSRAFSAQIDIYEAPNQMHGYVVTFSSRHANDNWFWSINVGVETHRDSGGWQTTG